MFAGQTLRVLVNARLTAAAEEIFALFERTTAEFEEELRRSREENQRKQELLDSVLSPRVALFRADLRTTENPGPGLDQDLDQGLDLKSTESFHIKKEPEEHCVEPEEELLDSVVSPRVVLVREDLRTDQKKSGPGLELEMKEEPEEDQLQVSVPESSAVCVMEEESRVFHQTEDEEETQGENDDEEPHLHPQTEGGSSDNYGKWIAPFLWSGELMPVQFRPNSEPSFKRNKHECPVCKKIFNCRSNLEIHIRIHTGEKPYSCPMCTSCFSSCATLKRHLRVHTGEKPYSCSVCNKTFSQRYSHKQHMRSHTNQEPYS